MRIMSYIQFRYVSDTCHVIICSLESIVGTYPPRLGNPQQGQNRFLRHRFDFQRFVWLKTLQNLYVFAQNCRCCPVPIYVIIQHDPLSSTQGICTGLRNSCRETVFSQSYVLSIISSWCFNISNQYKAGNAHGPKNWVQVVFPYFWYDTIINHLFLGINMNPNHQRNIMRDRWLQLLVESSWHDKTALS